MAGFKIAVFGHKRIPSREGGVEIVAEQLAARMAELGYHVTCYNRGDGAPNTEKFYRGIRLKRVLTLPGKGLAAVTSSISASFRAAFSRARVVHIHAEGPAFMCWLPRLLGKRVIVTVHGLDWQREKWKNGFASRYIRWGEKMAVRYADEIIVLSRNVQRYFRETYDRNTCWIPNGVERPAPQDGRVLTQEFGLQPESYILFLGRLVPEKGIHYLIEAFRSTDTPYKLVIAGASSDTDEYVQTLRKLAEGDERILFTGFAQGEILQALFSNAYLYVLPSDVEGMPLSLLEAMSYGNCCLTSDIAECTEVVENHGVTFRKGDIADLREKLQMLCDDSQMVAQYRQASADFICEKYNWDDVTKKTLELYQ